MTNKILLYTLLMLHSSAYIQCLHELTDVLHAEMKNNKNPILTQDTHPTVYAMVERLTAAAHVDMPRYITVYDAEGLMVARTGTVYKTIRNIDVNVTAFDDLCICYEILAELPYEVVEGILTVALAEKAYNVPRKLGAVVWSTLAATFAVVYCLNKYYELELGSFISCTLRNPYYCQSAKEDTLLGLAGLFLLPTFLVTKIVSNYLQKPVDVRATQIIDRQRVIDGIKGLIKLKDAYSQEGFFSRIASALKLKSIYNFLFYPVRAYTQEERMQYLSDLTMQAEAL